MCKLKSVQCQFAVEKKRRLYPSLGNINDPTIAHCEMVGVWGQCQPRFQICQLNLAACNYLDYRQVTEVTANYSDRSDWL